VAEGSLFYIKPPNKNVFSVQAYYQFESFGNKPAQVVRLIRLIRPTTKGIIYYTCKRENILFLFRNMDLQNHQHTAH
jgi:hypothetical protein